MISLELFGEDIAHVAVIGALATRVAKSCGVETDLAWQCASQGRGQVKRELSVYLRELDKGLRALPDLILVTTDSNCEGWHRRSQEMLPYGRRSPVPMVFAIPDPHIERWLLLDGAAFKAVFGAGCRAPDRKCSRDRYKRQLFESIRNAGNEVPVGGMEYAEEIVRHMDIARAADADKSFHRFISDLRSAFKRLR